MIRRPSALDRGKYRRAMLSVITATGGEILSLEGWRSDQGDSAGADGSFAGLTADVFSITKELFQEKPAILALSPLTVLIPLITAANWVNEIFFCRKWAAHFQEQAKTPRMLWDLYPGTGQI